VTGPSAEITIAAPAAVQVHQNFPGEQIEIIHTYLPREAARIPGSGAGQQHALVAFSDVEDRADLGTEESLRVSQRYHRLLRPGGSSAMTSGTHATIAGADPVESFVSQCVGVVEAAGLDVLLEYRRNCRRARRTGRCCEADR
jgi:hypothetical protein